ncbi:MAG: ABC transporter substrate-binding protein [Campylobacteraceae bacterium]|nr:ABC transporter substrate-binding protein [Campylobacteraceae bacterium]
MYKVLGIVFISIVSFFIYLSFTNSNEIKIGFIGGLSGKYSNLGHSLLNGMNLALEEENFEINGKKVRIISKDDRQRPTFAKLAVSEFKNDKIGLILGAGTSSMTKVVLDSFDENYKPILFSASASSSEFSKKDDNFFRTQVSQSEESFEKLSKYLLFKNLKNIYAIYDPNNRAYSETYVNNFRKSLFKTAGESFFLLKELSKDFSHITEDIKKRENIDAIIIIANTIDTAKLVQFLRISDIEKPIIGSSWSKNAKLLEDGGKYVEGMIFLTSYDNNSKNKKYINFAKKYEQRYKTKPSVFASQAYESTKIIVEVLQKNENIDEFKNTLLGIKKFEALQGEIEFDDYGDIKRKYLLMKVKNGQYEAI